MLSQLFIRFGGVICLLVILIGSFMSLAYADTAFQPVMMKNSSSGGGGLPGQVRRRVGKE